jgi:hypothetical protein
MEDVQELVDHSQPTKRYNEVIKHRDIGKLFPIKASRILESYRYHDNSCENIAQNR